MTQARQHTFGPVPSRRLGRSLGVELVPFKTCSFDCIYCQVGRTTVKTLRRAAYVPTEPVLVEVRQVLESGAQPDYITLAGAGEPTLHAELGEIITKIRAFADVPITVLTNGSLLWDREVREACALADIVIPTLAAHDDQVFQQIHRPVDGLTFERHVEGLLAFRAEHATRMWLELFLLDGLNATNNDLKHFSDLIGRIKPHRVQINTAVRPTAEADARAISAERLAECARLLGETAEVIAEVQRPREAHGIVHESEVLGLCRRRPCTLAQIADGLGVHINEAAKYVTSLQAAHRLRPERRGDQQYFVAC